MKSNILVVVAFCLVGACFCKVAVPGVRQGDSVNSSGWRNSSSVDIGEGIGRFYPIYENVPLGSKNAEDYFTDFGPFVNGSESALLKVIVRRTGTSSKGGLVAWVDDAKVAEDYSSISVTTRPGERMAFSVKDTAVISVYSSNPGKRAADMGMPTAADFVTPTGRYVKCVSYIEPLSSQTVTLYIYEAGSMSDRSSVGEALPSGLMFGPRPQSPGNCE